jgi:hypothetical protein
MPGNIEELEEIPLEQFGGLCTASDSSDVPVGMSPDCMDVQFLPGEVSTRPGTSSPYAAISGRIEWLRTFVPISGSIRVVSFTDAGVLTRWDDAGTPTTVSSALATSSRARSTTLFGTEFLAIGDGTIGTDRPYGYDDANLDRVSQEGPGAGPTVADSGTAGNVSAGLHGVVVWFETRRGAWTQCSPPVSWTALGGKKASLTGIPLGPANVSKRLLGFTGAGGADYYNLPKTLVINDNTTTALTVDFTDSSLLAGTKVNYLFTLQPLPPAAGVIDYNNRLLWWGVQPYMPFWRNLSFDGGFSASGLVPLGWTSDGTGGGAGVLEAFGYSYRITGDGVNGQRGGVTQNALIEAWTGTALILPNTAYTVRARVWRSAGANKGSLNIDLFGAVGTAIDTTGLHLDISTLPTSPAEFTATLTPAQAALSTDLVLRVFAYNDIGGILPNGEWVKVDDIRIYPSLKPRQGSVAYWSQAEEPDQYDAGDSLMQVRPDDGQELRGAYVIRGYCYLLKQRGLHVTQDDGENEPTDWPVQVVDEIVGTDSMQGWCLGDGFALIAARPGLYFHSGGPPVKISREVQRTWDSINWAAASTISVALEEEKRRVYIAVPTGASVRPNQLLVLDYSDGDGAYGALLTDPMSNEGQGRKWTIWRLSVDTVARVVRGDGPHIYLGGNAAGNNNVLMVDDTQRQDFGAVAINGYYDTAFLTLTGASRRNLFQFLTAYAYGSGTLSVTAYKPAFGGGTLQASLALSNPGTQDLQAPLNFNTERASFRFETNAVGSWFTMSKAAFYADEDPWAPIR